MVWTKDSELKDFSWCHFLFFSQLDGENVLSTDVNHYTYAKFKKSDVDKVAAFKQEVKSKCTDSSFCALVYGMMINLWTAK